MNNVVPVAPILLPVEKHFQIKLVIYLKIRNHLRPPDADTESTGTHATRPATVI
jgi:hypothetical protein